MNQLKELIQHYQDTESSQRYLKMQILDLMMEPHQYLINHSVKIKGQKGWCVGVVKNLSVRHNSYLDISKWYVAADVFSGKKTITIEIKNLQLLTQADQKINQIHQKINDKNQQ